MIKNRTKLNSFYKELLKKEDIPYKKALKIYELLLDEAVSLGVINSSNILDGLEVDIRIAKAINALGACPSNDL